MNNIIIGEDNKARCKWGASDDLHIHYHDTEWGFPVIDDFRLFKKICLEGFQSGLSWRTILVKRENFRKAFAGFDFNKVAQFDENDITRLLNDAGIVRHRGKIEATINNAKRAIELKNEFGTLAHYFWQYENQITENFTPQSAQIGDNSTKLSKDLKKRGWKFVGPTTIYAFMQAMGLVNDHYDDCYVRDLVKEERKNFEI